MRKFYIAVAAAVLAMQADAAVFHAKESAELCRSDSPGACTTVGPDVLMESLQEDGDVWRVRVSQGAGFTYYSVRRDDIEPAIGTDGKKIEELCKPWSNTGGVHTRTEVGADGTVRVKRFLISTSCKDGKTYSTTKALN